MAFSGVVRALDDQVPDDQYLRLVRTVLEEGEVQEGRNGMVRVVIGVSLAFDLAEGRVPLLTSKRLAWKTCLPHPARIMVLNLQQQFKIH